MLQNKKKNSKFWIWALSLFRIDRVGQLKFLIDQKNPLKTQMTITKNDPGLGIYFSSMCDD